MSFVLDWLFGGQSTAPTPTRWLDESYEVKPDSPPILQLNLGIVSHAIAQRASRIDLWMGIPEFEYTSVETIEEYERRIDMGISSSDLTRSDANIAGLMAAAGIVSSVYNNKETPPTDHLTVMETFGEFQVRVLTIPANIVLPSIRAYPFSFNFKLCATTARPENIIYVRTKERAAFASIDHYDRVGDHKLGICLEYED